MAKVSVGVRQLEQWARDFESAPTAVKSMVAEVAQELLNFTYERFRLETDPYGNPWVPKKGPDGRKTLSGETGRLKNGWHIVRADLREIRIRPSVAYAVYHQSSEPRTKLPRRMMVPDPALGLPSELAARLEDAIDDVLDAHFGAGRASAARRTLGISKVRIAQ